MHVYGAAVDRIRVTALKIIDRYVIKEVLYALLAVTPVLLLIFVSNRLLLYLTEVAAGKLPGDVIFTLLGLKAIRVLALVLPLTFFLSVVLALGRLYKDSEMTVLAACGVSTAQMARIVLVPALALALVVAWLATYVDPWANQQSTQVKQRAETDAEISAVVPGRFKESRRGDHIFYAEQISPDYRFMRNIFVQSRQHGKLNILAAENGSQYTDPHSGSQFILLRDGYRYEWTPGQSDYKIINYEKYTLRIDQKAPPAAEEKRDLKPTAVLLRSTETADIAELQWRLSMPISAVLLALLAVVLARTTPRQGRYAKLAVAVLVYIIYNNMMSVARSWVERGVVPLWPGMGWVHLGLLAVLAVLFVQEMGVSGLAAARRARHAKPASP